MELKNPAFMNRRKGDTNMSITITLDAAKKHPVSSAVDGNRLCIEAKAHSITALKIQK